MRLDSDELALRQTYVSDDDFRAFFQEQIVQSSSRFSVIDCSRPGHLRNGPTQSLGQILLATFANEQGLSHNGSNQFLSTLSSGAANVGVPGTGGRGTLSGGSLEQSNVDISTQFANLIVAESGYQANAKVVTTLDTIVQDTINLIQ